MKRKTVTIHVDHVKSDTQVPRFNRMNRKTVTILVVIGALLLLVLSVVGSYNGMVTKNEAVSAKLRDIDTQLQRRMDLIPNLVSTVKGYAAHEQKIMKDVSDARAKLAGAATVGDKSNANDQLSGALSRLLAIAENYPDLKANQNFLALQDQLEGTENRIAVARKDYNDAVKDYNTTIRRFPTSIGASIFGFKSADYFQSAAGAQNAPQVTFGS